MQKQHAGNCKFEAVPCVLLTGEAGAFSAMNRGSDRHALSLYCAVTEGNKINMCFCADKKVPVTCTQSLT